MSQFDDDEESGHSPWQKPPAGSLVDSYYANHGKPWSIEDNQMLMHKFAYGETLKITSLGLKRKESAVATQCARMLVKFMNGQDLKALAYLTKLRRNHISEEFLGAVLRSMELNNNAALLKFNRIILGGGEVITQVNSTKLSEKYVNYNHLITLLQKGYTTCEVTFNEPKAGDVPRQFYTFKIADGLKNLGCDRVVVENDRGQYIVAWIHLIHETPQIDVSAPYSYKWVIDVVREQDYIEQAAREKQAIKMLQDGEREKAQREALETLMASVPNREELMKLLGN